MKHYEIEDTRNMLQGALNRMTITNDPKELDNYYQSALAYVEKLKKLNAERIDETVKFRAAHPEYKSYT